MNANIKNHIKKPSCQQLIFLVINIIDCKTLTQPFANIHVKHLKTDYKYYDVLTYKQQQY